MFIIKLGGSVITDKTKENTFKHATMRRLADEIKKAHKEIILIHGAGSFGHIPAEKHQLNQGFKHQSQLKGFSETHVQVRKLNNMIMESLLNEDLSVVSVPPLLAMKLKNHQTLDFNYSLFENLLQKGFLPVSFGDVVFDQELGFSICSGDLLVEILAMRYKPVQVIFVIDEDGLYTANPKTNEKAELLSHVTTAKLQEYETEADKHSDVTGGMKGKINTIKRIAGGGIPTFLLNGNKAGRLYKTLIGEETKGTLIPGDAR